jgi:hypothetical protein
MKYKIILNPGIRYLEILEIKEAIKDNDGYCPCRVSKNEDTKCMCKEFREQESGVCHCGLYEKVPKRCMISQPMSDVDESIIQEVRARAIKVIEEMGYEYRSTYYEDDSFKPYLNPRVTKPGVAYLSRALDMLSTCDAMYFVKGWENSCGCRVEEFVCKTYGIKCIYE